MFGRRSAPAAALLLLDTYGYSSSSRLASGAARRPRHWPDFRERCASGPAGPHPGWRARPGAGNLRERRGRL